MWMAPDVGSSGSWVVVFYGLRVLGPRQAKNCECSSEGPEWCSMVRHWSLKNLWGWKPSPNMYMPLVIQPPNCRFRDKALIHLVAFVILGCGHYLPPPSCFRLSLSQSSHLIKNGMSTRKKDKARIITITAVKIFVTYGAKGHPVLETEDWSWSTKPQLNAAPV